MHIKNEMYTENKRHIAGSVMGFLFLLFLFLTILYLIETGIFTDSWDSLIKNDAYYEAKVYKIIGADAGMEKEQIEEKTNLYLAKHMQTVSIENIIEVMENSRIAYCKIINGGESNIGITFIVCDEKGDELYHSNMIEAGLGVMQFPLTHVPEKGWHSCMVYFDVYSIDKEEDIYIGSFGRTVSLHIE